MRLILIARNKPNECRIIYGTHTSILHINRIRIGNWNFFSGFFYQFIQHDNPSFVSPCEFVQPEIEKHNMQVSKMHVILFIKNTSATPYFTFLSRQNSHVLPPVTPAAHPAQY